MRSLLWPIVLIVFAATMYAVVRHKRDLVDFEVYRTAGIRFVAAEPLYRPEDGHYQFKYLPAFALAMVPLAWITPELAKAAWFALSFALLVIFIRQSIRALPERRLTDRHLMWLAILFVGRFYVKELVLGQTNVLLGVVLIAALMAAQRNAYAWSGALVGLAVFIKPYAVILLPWLAVAQGAVAVVVSGSVLVAGLLIPALIYGWNGNISLVAAWYRTVTDTTAPNLLLPENISFATMWAKWLGVGPAAASLTIITGVAALLLVAAVVWKRRAISEPRYLEFGLIMLLVPMLSPQGWDYVLLLATPAILCLLDRWSAVPVGWRVITSAGLAIVGFTIFDLLGRTLYARFMAMSIVSVAVVVLIVSLVHLRWRALA